MTDHLGPLNLILLIVPGIALRMAVWVMYGRPSGMVRNPVRTALSLAGTLLIVIGLIGIFVTMAGIFVIPLAIVAGVAALMVLDRMRRAEHRALLFSLAVAAERGIPLTEAALAYADENQGDTGTRAARLAQALRQGRPLSQAVQHARLRLAAPMGMAVRLGESLGILGPAMRQQLDEPQQADARIGETVGRFVYLMCTVIVMQGVVAFVMLRIVPVFQRMFSEFGLKLPSLTTWVIEVSTNGDVLFLMFLIVAVPLAMLSLVYSALMIVALMTRLLDPQPQEGESPFPRRFRWTQGLRFVMVLLILILICPFYTVAILFLPLILYYIGFFPRDVPILWLLFRRYDGAIIMRGLALAVRRQVPLPQAVELVAAKYPIRQASRALQSAAVQIRNGRPWPDSLLQTGLISRADAAVLAAAQRAGNLPWALEEMAESTLRRMNYRLQIALQVLFPPVILTLGVVVALFVIGMFMPLIALIQGLT